MNSVLSLVGLKMTRQQDGLRGKISIDAQRHVCAVCILVFFRLEPHAHQRVDLIQEPLTSNDVVVVVWCRCDVAFFRTYIHVVVEQVVATGGTKHSCKNRHGLTHTVED